MNNKSVEEQKQAIINEYHLICRYIINEYNKETKEELDPKALYSFYTDIMGIVIMLHAPDDLTGHVAGCIMHPSKDVCEGINELARLDMKLLSMIN